jgi:hypothetical protein
LSGRPPTPPCVPFGTRRFNEFRAVPLAYTHLFKWLQIISLSALSPSVLSGSLPLGTPIGSLGFHPTPPWVAGSHRFLPFHSTLPTHPLGNFHYSALRFTFTRLFHGHRSSLLWPLLTSCTSAIHYCIDSFTVGRFVSLRIRYVQDLPG